MPISLEYFKDTDEKTKPETKWVTSVYAKWPANGLYYKVELLSLNREKNSFRIRYEDNLEVETLAKDLHCELDGDELNDDDIVCCVCGQGDNEANIILCDACNQGYHLECHQPNPKLNKEQLEDENHQWICATCEYMVDCQSHSKKKSRQSTASRICVTPIKQKRDANATAKCQSEPKRKAFVAPKNIKKTPKVKLNKPLKAPPAPSIPTEADSQQRKIKQMSRKQNTADQSVAEELVETQIVEFAQPDLDVKAEREANMTNSIDNINGDTNVETSENQTVITKSKGKVDTLSPELVVVAETLTEKPSSVGKKSLNTVVDSVKMVDIVNDESCSKRASLDHPKPLAITNGESRSESPTVNKAPKRPRKTSKNVAPAS